MSILVFAGTTEGRKITEFLGGNGVKVHAFCATTYGRELLPEGENITAQAGRLDEQQMEELIKENSFELVIDATHPYAAVVTENIKKACLATETEYIRLLRGESDISGKDIVYADSVADAVSILEQTKGNILAATGSKELSEYTKLTGYKERVYARVLSTPEVTASCAALGFGGKHLICMQGPFTRQMNEATLRMFGCRYMVTKESGKEGGFMEKYEAAKECGAVLIVVGRPVKEEGMSLKELKRELCIRLGLKVRQKITLAGIGMGSEANMTGEVREAFSGCDLLIGAGRMVKNAAPGCDVFTEYNAQKIAEYINEHPEYENITVALSGDTGFFSGAKRLLEVLPEGAEVLPGISSMSYFCAKIGIAWEDVVPVSLHGKDTNIAGLLKENKRVFAIVGDSECIGTICEKLVSYGMGDTVVYIGERLSYTDESINCASANAFSGCETDALSVVLFERRNFNEPVASHGIPDDEFVRGNVPMTKEEIREIVISKLRLKRDSVVYDIGAGTGSISVEASKVALMGKVYAIEKNPDAAKFLVKENKEKFVCDNLEIVCAKAPEALEGLPAPTHAFIGGSSRNLKAIILCLLKKNPSVRIVMTCITLETVTEALDCLNTLPLKDADIVQVTVSKSKLVGSYNMMTGQNPVYIISCEGRA